ncbi:PREDICTED: zinc-finger homeodomain protein 2-like isoform X2 [Lupinus angustifolius]|uniref:zinc-finger homeodomain protein 2-like isoform X2 n=1 Tax=Lupinus angustifolius TaxID=3871 RepID=UPI00092E21AC|nr:PREDICTED: zinc-finger homeodomain protein 2-like isoform X2 [Lupinus angustifolius]
MEEMEKDMEFVQHEERCIKLPPPPPPPQPENNSHATTENAIMTAPPTQNDGPTMGTIKYRECQKNHAKVIGVYVVDGCGEFLGSGEEGTLEAAICAVCNCRRNFHREEISNRGVPYQPPMHYHNHHVSACYQCVPPPPPGVGYHHHVVVASPVSQHSPLALPVAYDGGSNLEEKDISNPSSSGGSGRGKKRFRTKFSKEQKDRMLAFAEKVGWRIRKHDAAAVEQFCAETGVKRQVLNVWMHNHKHTLGKKT